MRYLSLPSYPALALLCLGLARPPARAETETARQQIPFPNPRLTVSGLPWFHEDQPVLRRLPLRLKDQLRPPVWDLAQHPSGGRIRFRTDSTTIGLLAENPYFSNMHHMASVGESGFDLYVGPDYLGSAWPDAAGKIDKQWRVGTARRMRDITLYLPLYKSVTVRELNLDPEARLEPATPYAMRKPIVYYGSSITQGGCASNPGGSCQAILERRLHADFVNLGFSGNGMGEPVLAEAITELDPSVIVLDFWGNPKVDQYAAALPVLLMGDVRGQRVADLCAAPGGKTLQLAAAGALVTAVDRSDKRLDRLRQNLDRMALAATVIAADLRVWRPETPFDAVLLDAPCSATGTLRRHPDGLHLKKPGDVVSLSEAQGALLNAAAAMVRPGGLLLYSVCSLETVEGEDQVAAFLTQDGSFVREAVRAEEIGGLAQAITPGGDLRTLPCHWADRGGLDGFFAARLRKIGEPVASAAGFG